jgi:4-amino-4-deoxy-L-arabinose transferase-like glycosyltransferase
VGDRRRWPRRDLTRGHGRLILGLLFLALAAVHLSGLGYAPPGLYNDETGVGYDAWSIAHHGVDQHGVHLPLFFQSFGDWKGPVVIYTLVPWLWFLPLTSWVVRLPSAIAGVLLCAAGGWLGWEMRRNRRAVAIGMLTAGLEPWFFLMTRTTLEADAWMVLAYVASLAALLRGAAGRDRWVLAAGVAAGMSIFTAIPGRVFALAFAVLAWWCWRGALRGRRQVLLLAPVVAGYVVLGAAALAGSQVGARFGQVNAFSDHPSLPVAAWRLLSHWAGAFDPVVLFVSGDNNLRHSTGFLGLLLPPALLAVVAGGVWARRYWREPIARFAVLGLAIAPIPAATTTGYTARRVLTMLPFVLVLVISGWSRLLETRRHERVIAMAAAVAAGICAVLYVGDLFVNYPSRAAAAFDRGEQISIRAAVDARQGHALLLSQSLDQPYIQALYVLRADPTGGQPLTAAGITILHARSDLDLARPGDVMVLTEADGPPPTGSELLNVEARGSDLDGTGRGRTVLVYRR